MEEALRRSIEQYVTSCFDRESPPRVDELAQLLSISRATLHRRCMELLGESPSAILRRARLLRAQELLTRSDLSTSQVAYRSGCGTRRTMFRLFQRSLGRTPRATDCL